MGISIGLIGPMGLMGPINIHECIWLILHLINSILIFGFLTFIIKN